MVFFTVYIISVIIVLVTRAGMLWGGALVLVATGLVTGFNPLQWLGALRRTDD